MTEFLAICDYFDITPVVVFDENLANSGLMNQAILGLEQLREEDLMLVMEIINRFLKND